MRRSAAAGVARKKEKKKSPSFVFGTLLWHFVETFFVGGRVPLGGADGGVRVSHLIRVCARGHRAAV